MTGPSPVILESPSASPVADKATAGKGYLAAAGVYNKGVKALERKYKTFGTLARVHAYYRKAAKLDRAFSDAIRKIAFPPEMAGDVKSLLQKNAALESSEIELGHTSAGAYAGALKAWDRASRSSSAAANLMRQDLGLPSVPF